MLAKIYKWLLNRKNIAGEIKSGACCAVPNCNNNATEQWFPSFCALRDAGIEIEWVPVCTTHDIELNAANIKILFGDKYNAEIRDYQQRREART